MGISANGSDKLTKQYDLCWVVAIDVYPESPHAIETEAIKPLALY